MVGLGISHVSLTVADHWIWSYISTIKQTQTDWELRLDTGKRTGRPAGGEVNGNSIHINHKTDYRAPPHPTPNPPVRHIYRAIDEV